MKEKIEKSLDKKINEKIDIQLLIASMLDENKKYFINDVVYEIEIKNGKGIVIETENLFEDNVPLAVLSFRIIHNLSMLYNYYIYFSSLVAENGEIDVVNLINHKLDIDKTYYLQIIIEKNQQVTINKRKGFGMFTYNVDDMIVALLETYFAVKNYVLEMLKESKYKEIKKVTDFIDSKYTMSGPDEEFTNFFVKNKEIFNKYLKKVEKIKNKYK